MFKKDYGSFWPTILVRGGKEECMLQICIVLFKYVGGKFGF